jgi:hypothetical protein
MKEAIVITAMLRRIVRPGRRYAKERARLRAAISNTEIDPGQALTSAGPALNKILGWNSFFDGGDWVELEMEAEERKITVESVSDFLHLLELVDDQPQTPSR